MTDKSLSMRYSRRPIRWTAQKKADLIAAIMDGAITRKQALERYELSEEELQTWEADFDRYGEKGLKATYTSKKRRLWRK